MDIEHTERGFSIANFKDRNDVECSIQKSSIATEDCIWLGCNNANPKIFTPGKGWQKLDIPGDVSFDTRMHLTQDQAAELIPILQRFVDTGELD